MVAKKVRVRNMLVRREYIDSIIVRVENVHQSQILKSQIVIQGVCWGIDGDVGRV